jgi:amino acid transporter
MVRKHTTKIGLFASVAFAVGAMVGGGVFALSGAALAQAGPAALVSFLVAGSIVLLSAFSFMVIASKASREHPGYDYVGKVLGRPIWGYLTSWCFYLAGIIGAAFVLNAFGSYVSQFITPGVPPVVWSIVGALLLTLINLGPASEIGRVEMFLVGGKLLILLTLIGFGIAHFSTSDLAPFAPHGDTSIFTTGAFLFVAFLGFNVITNMASDIKSPQKTIPKAILISMVIVTVIYIGVAITLLSSHITDYSESSVGSAAVVLMGPIGGGLVIAGALISTLSSGNANILGASEIVVRLAAGKKIPTIMGDMWHGHPYVSVLSGAVLYIGLILSGQTQTVIDLANVTAILALTIVNIAAARALTLRSHTGFRLPFGWLLPMLGAVGALMQFAFIPLTNVIIGIALAGIGVIFYSLRHSAHLPLFHRRIAAQIEAVDGPLSRSLHE